MKTQYQVIAEGRAELLWLRVKSFIFNRIGWCLEKVQAPAKLREFEFVDPASDETVYLYTSKRYSVFCVGDRRFYFDRITGKFDGVSTSASLITNGVELGD
jgi:hypothetical protein